MFMLGDGVAAGLKVQRPKVRGERIRGIPVVGGIACGTAHVLNRRLDASPRRRIRQEDVQAEKSRLKSAFDAVKKQFDEARGRLLHRNHRKISEIIEAYRLMIADPTLLQGVVSVLERELINAEWALERNTERLRAELEAADSAYLAERAADLHHIADRLMRSLLGIVEPVGEPRTGDTVIVAHDLSPADMLGFGRQKVTGFAVDIGGPTSHTAILARSLGIPAVIGAAGVSDRAAAGDEIIVDGIHGDVWLRPEKNTRQRLSSIGRRYSALAETLIGEDAAGVETSDRKAVTLMANIEFTDEVETATRHGAMGIGLLRTEYLFVNRRRPPSEEEHFRAYNQVAMKMAPNPVTIRTLDVGGDKVSGPFQTLREPNPALGMRAIRFCLKERRIFIPQIRGILRASAHGKIRLMIPMISSMEESLETKKLIAGVMEDFEREGIPYDRDMQIGCMIEVPGAAIIADLLAREFDFFSIGTNDLIQYTLAVDRGNDRVAPLFQPLHTAVLRLIKNIVEAGHRFGVSTAVCGEMASNPVHFLLLLGAGVREFSMYPQAIPFIRHTARSTTIKAARTLFDAVYHARTVAEAAALSEKYLEEHFPEVSNL